MSSYSTASARPAGLSRRALLTRLALAAGTAGTGAIVWNRFDLRSRLFNPFTRQNFDLAPVAGVKLSDGRQAPGFSAGDFEGHVTILNFWASWCPPCIGEHPHLVAMAKDKRLRIFGANYKDAPEAADRFLAERGNPYQAVGADTQGFVSRAFGARGVPWTYVIDRSSQVAFTLPGPIDETNVNSILLPAVEKVLKG